MRFSVSISKTDRASEDEDKYSASVPGDDEISTSLPGEVPEVIK
jgi:hypothetical protein